MGGGQDVLGGDPFPIPGLDARDGPCHVLAVNRIPGIGQRLVAGKDQLRQHARQ